MAIYTKWNPLHSKKELQISNSYSYDRKGNITSAYSLQGKSVQKTYNPFNQVSKETIKDGEGTYTLEYSYDRKGRLKTITLPDQSKIAYTYDAVFGREVNRISSQGEILYTHTYDSYDLQGKLISENHIGYAGSQEYTYNLNGQKIATKSDFLDEEIVRDVLGRVTEVKGEKPEHYIYNDLSQLISEKKHTHAYDSLDNRIQANNDELVYNALNQLISHANTEFSYDAQGNLLRKVLDGEETRFESNILSQLTTIEKADQTALTFSYDPFGRLLVEKHLDVKGKNKKTLTTTRYLYLGYQEIGTLSSTRTIESLKIPGIHGDELSPKSVAFETKGETYVPLHDIAGNVVRHPSILKIDKSLRAMNTPLLGKYRFLMQKVNKKTLHWLAILGNLPKRESMTNQASFYLDFAFMIQISADGLVKILPEASTVRTLTLIFTIIL